MKLFLISGALAVVLIAGALFLVERRMKARSRRVLADQQPVQGDPVIELRMGVSTSFADGMPALFEKGEMDVICTTGTLVAGLVIPLPAVEEAAIEGGTLKVRWTSGVEKLVTTLRARRHDLERLRREIHLRQPNVIEKLISMVQK